MAQPTPVYVGCKPCVTCERVKPLSEFSRIGMRLRKVCDPCRDEAVPETEICPRCGETKPRDAFVTSGAVRTLCHDPCMLAERRAQYWADPKQQGRQRRPRLNPPALASTRPTAPPGYRWCTKGGECKPVSEFPRTKTGHGSWCKACVAEHNREQYKKPEVRADRMARWTRWRAMNPGWSAEYYARDLEHSREKMRRAANLRRARLRGLPVEPYTMAELVERDGPWCVLCDEELDFSVDHPDPDTPTVEHLECISWPNSAGDVPSNCAVAHLSCNSRRNDRPHPAAARRRAELLAALAG